MEKEIKILINERINPVLAQHGGSAVLKSFKNGVVELELLGGCQGCPGRRNTLLNGIKPFLMGELPGLSDVTIAD